MSLLDRFRPTVRIHASPDEFRFESSGAEARFRTLFEPPAGARGVEWFDRDAFVRYFRYGVTLVNSSALWIAPRAEVVADPQLDRLLAGAAARVLVPLIREAGAAQVSFTLGRQAGPSVHARSQGATPR